MINYVQGDAVIAGACEGPKMIAHIVNNQGGWGKGFVVPLGSKYPIVKQRYKEWDDRELGKVQYVFASVDVIVANMCAQDGYSKPGKPAIRYEQLAKCLALINGIARIYPHFTVHMPRIGCGLAGGKWNQIERLINNNLTSIPVYVYDLL